MTTQVQPGESLLVKTIQAFLEGQATEKSLAEAVEVTRKSLHEHYDAFQQTMDSLVPEVKAKVQGLIDSAEDLFSGYTAALDQVGVFLKTKDKEQLYGAGSLAARAAYQLDLLFFQLRNAALAAQGPTDIANYNLILMAYQVMLDGKEPGERFRELIQAERLVAVSSLQEIESGPKTPEMEQLRQAFDTHLRCANRIAIAFDAGKKEMLAGEVEKLKASFLGIREVIADANISQRETGPTQSPQVNLVLSLAKDVEAMNVHESVLIEALGALYESLKESRKSFEDMVARPSESVILTEEIERTLKAFDQQETALKEFAEFFENRETLVMESAMSKLEQSAEALYDCYEQMQAIADREGKTLCIRCSHYNPSHRTHCEKCGAALPAMARDQAVSTFAAEEGKAESEASTDSPILTPNFVRLYTAVNKIAENEITPEEYLAELDWFDSILDKYGEYEIDEQAVDQVAPDHKADSRKAVDELEAAFTLGFTEIVQALEMLRRYPETLDRNDLEEGVKLCDQGARKIAKVREATNTAGTRK